MGLCGIFWDLLESLGFLSGFFGFLGFRGAEWDWVGSIGDSLGFLGSWGIDWDFSRVFRILGDCFTWDLGGCYGIFWICWWFWKFCGISLGFFDFWGCHWGVIRDLGRIFLRILKNARETLQVPNQIWLVAPNAVKYQLSGYLNPFLRSFYFEESIRIPMNPYTKQQRVLIGQPKQLVRWHLKTP